MAKEYLVSIDLNKNELQNAAVQNLATAPSSPALGQIYYDTAATPDRIYVWNGSAWALLATDSDLLGGQTLAQVRARSSHTGTQTASTISDFDTQVRTSRLDQMAAPTADVAFNSRKITGLLDPTNAQDAATKAYVDAARNGLDVKDSVDVASTANVSGTYNATGGTSARGQFTAMTNVIDGVTLVNGDRVLLKDQSTGAQNGIWAVTTVGTGANGVWDRATDFDSDAEVTGGSFTFVERGTANADTGWVLQTNDPIIIGGGSGTTLVFVQFSSAGVILGGAGILKTGNTLDVVAGASPSSGGPGGGLVVAADSIAIDTGVVVRKFAAAIGDGAATAIVVTHNLNTRDITATCVRATTPWDIVECDIEATTVNTVTYRFAVAPTSAEHRAVIHG